jgi:membrane fusion protein (multidrug efflux system)
MADLIETQVKESNGETASREEGPSSFLGTRPHAKWWLLVLGLIAIGVAAGVWHYFSIRETTDDAQIDGHIIPISARVGGTVIAVEVNDNQAVQVGTILVKIDPRDYQVSVERAQADLASAEAAAQAARTGVPVATTTTGSQVSNSQASVEMAQAGIQVARQQVGAARARLTAAKARLTEAQANDTKAAKDLERMKQLVSKDEVSQQQYDAADAAAKASHAVVESAQADEAEAEQAVDVAESRLVQSRAALAQARAELESAQTGPQQVAITRSHASSAEARVQEAKAALDQAELNLQYTTIQAPVGGRVSKKTVEIGQVIQAGQPLMAIVPLEDIWVTANFKETQLKNMRPGQPVTISVDAFGGRKFKGHVDSIAAATGEKFSLLPPENATGNYVKVVQRIPVKIVFEKGEDPHHLLRPGMSVEPTVITQ